jgi:2-iminobutanoate/2-iminopropanoate deaminase
VDGWLYVSGQGPLDLATGEVLRGSVEDETRATLANVDKVLRAAGCGPEDVVKCTCHISRIEDFDAFNKVYAEYFTGIRPARTTVQSVLWGGIKVEIDCVARVPSR